ncbi:hypothetical protein [Actinomadura macra]|uniref:hypothetical protein n=1 Tax=Actinomadura macra TaxID=46164 RepID=UPI00082FED8F|nr:hypothetical protein [Actinomadura macra]
MREPRDTFLCRQDVGTPAPAREFEGPRVGLITSGRVNSAGPRPHLTRYSVIKKIAHRVRERGPMRKIVITGVAAALALGLTACGGDGDGNSAASSSPPQPLSPVSSAPAQGNATPGASSAPGAPGGSGAPTAQRPASAPQGGQQIKSATGRLRYLAPGKFTVGNVVFFTANDTVLYVAGGKCPDGSTPPDVSKCSIVGFDNWAKAAPHNVTVRFSGQAATLIRETQ